MSLNLALHRLLSLRLTLSISIWNYGHIRLRSLEITSDGTIYFVMKAKVI